MCVCVCGMYSMYVMYPGREANANQAPNRPPSTYESVQCDCEYSSYTRRRRRFAAAVVAGSDVGSEADVGVGSMFVGFLFFCCIFLVLSSFQRQLSVS